MIFEALVSIFVEPNCCKGRKIVIVLSLIFGLWWQTLINSKICKFSCPFLWSPKYIVIFYIIREIPSIFHPLFLSPFLTFFFLHCHAFFLRLFLPLLLLLLVPDFKNCLLDLFFFFFGHAWWWPIEFQQYLRLKGEMRTLHTHCKIFKFKKRVTAFL